MNLVSQAIFTDANQGAVSSNTGRLFSTALRVIKNLKSYACFALLCSTANSAVKNETDGEYYVSDAVAQVPLTYITYSQLNETTFKGIYSLELKENEYNQLSFQSICVCGNVAEDGALGSVPVYNQLVFYNSDGSVKTFTKKTGESMVIMIEIVLTFSTSGADFELFCPWENNLLVKWLLGTIDDGVKLTIKMGINEKKKLDIADHVHDEYLMRETYYTFSSKDFVIDEETNTLTISYRFNYNNTYLMSEYRLHMNKTCVGRFSVVLDSYTPYIAYAATRGYNDNQALIRYPNYLSIENIYNYTTGEYVERTLTFTSIPNLSCNGRKNDVFTYYKNFEKFYMSADKSMIGFLMQGKLDVFKILEDDTLEQIDTSMVNIQNAKEILMIDDHLFIFTNDDDILRNYYNENLQFMPKNHSLNDALTDKLYTLSFSQVVVTKHVYENGVVMFRFGVLPAEANSEGKMYGYVLEMAENENKDVWFQRSFVCDEIDNISKVVCMYPYEDVPDCIMFATAQDSTTNAYALRMFYGEPLACVTPEKQILASYLTREDALNYGQLGRYFYTAYADYKNMVVAFEIPSGAYYHNTNFTDVYGSNVTFYSTKYNYISGYDMISKNIFVVLAFSFRNAYTVYFKYNGMLNKPAKLILLLNHSFIVVPDEGEELTCAFQGDFMMNAQVASGLDGFNDNDYIYVGLNCRPVPGSPQALIEGTFSLTWEGENV